jgi:hypothetical protein
MQSIEELTKLYIEPRGELNIIGYKITHDIFLTPTVLFIYEDFDKVQFAKQVNDNFALPTKAYKKEILGDTYIDCNELLKEPKQQVYHYQYANSRETCNVLNSLIGQSIEIVNLDL